MGKIVNFLQKIIKRKLFWLVLAIIIGVGGYLINKSIQETRIEYVTEKVKRRDIWQTVSATGTVTSSAKIDLNFEVVGAISKILVDEGDEVVAGQVLAKIDNKNAAAQVRQAQASFAAALANLNKLLVGVSQEDMKVSEESMNNAKISYENAKRDYDVLIIKLDQDIATYKESVAAAEVALSDSQKNLENVKNFSSQSIVNAKNSAITSMDTNLLLGDIVLNNINYNLTLLGSIATNPMAVSNCQTYRLLAISEIGQSKNYLNIAKGSNNINDAYTALNQSISALNKVLASLNYLFEAVSTASARNVSELNTIETLKTNIRADQVSISGAISSVQNAQQSLINAENNHQSQVDNYQSSVNTALNNLQKAQVNLSAALASREAQISQARATIDSAMGSYNLAKAQYAYKVASPRDVDIAYYRAQVAQTKAALDLAQNQLDQYTLRAPSDGEITFVNYEEGEQAGLSKPVISMLGKEKFYIEVDIPESDIAKIKIDNPAEITLDAYSDDIKFRGGVVLIYPAETVIQDVVYYKVKVEMQESIYEIKSGMTANCDILTAQKSNALTMPYRAAQEKNGQKFVRLLTDKKIIEREITIGLRGDEGEVEILSGLKEGDSVIVFERKGKK